MKIHYFLFVLCFFILSCEPTRKAAPPLPQGVERGMTWENATDYGYVEDIYVTPDYIAYALKGSHNVLSAASKTYGKDICENGPSRLTIQQVISKDGNVIGIHPMDEINPGCKSLLAETFKRFKFFPAEHNDTPVNMMMAITIVDRRN